ncbi:MAG: tail fiber domain-containing protein, partial [Candidatus Sungbacteria bacterium]|nr:tail fiber domain-containing protein [Candidatus Sungbacteria bacterium]
GTLVAIHGSAPILTLGDSQSSGAQYRLRNGSITAGTFDIYDNGAAASRLSINNAGNVGIGTTSPWRTESVVGTIGWSSSLGTGTGGNYLCIDTTTFEVLRGNGAACTASSLRFKENVQDIKYGLSDVLKLHPVSYTYKPETNMGTGTKLGFIADEMQSVIPEVVTLDKDGKVFGLDYPVLTSILAKAIQELDAKINALSLSSGSTTTPDSLMVKKIASSLGNWSIDEDGTLMAVKIITDEIVTQKLTVGSASKPSGITIYDEVTKEPYCIKVRNGAMVSEAGICGNQNDKGQMTNQAQSSNDQSTATAAPSTPVEPVASSTPAATETAATSTSPVSETIATSTGGLTP